LYHFTGEKLSEMNRKVRRGFWLRWLEPLALLLLFGLLLLWLLLALPR